MQHVALPYTVVTTPTWRVRHAALLAAAAKAGLPDARPGLSTGNLVFHSDMDEPTITAALDG